MWIWVLPDPTRPPSLRFRNVPPAVLRGHEFMTRLWHWTKIIHMVVQTCGYFGRCIPNAQSWPMVPPLPTGPTVAQKH